MQRSTAQDNGTARDGMETPVAAGIAQHGPLEQLIMMCIAQMDGTAQNGMEIFVINGDV